MSKNTQNVKKEKKSFNPNGYVIITILIILAVIATWIVPAGMYDRVTDAATGREVVDPLSFKYIESTPVGPFEALVAIPQGIRNMSGIIAFIFIVAGATAVVKSTGAIDAGLLALVNKFKGKDAPLLIVTIILCSLTGTLLGFAQEIIPFIPLGVAMALSLGYDKIVGFDMVRTSTWIGFAASTLNPYVVTVAQEMAGLPIMSGLGYRTGIYVVFMAISILYFLYYAKKVKEDPKNSLVYDYESEVDQTQFEMQDVGPLTTSHKLALLTFAVGLGIAVYGIEGFGWGTNQMAAVLLVAGVIAGFVGGFGPDRVAKEFTAGMAGITSGALIAGFTGAIAIILSDGKILDTIVYALATPLSNVSGVVTVIGMVLLYSIITFFIGSAAGRAAATLPILIPLGDILGITRQTVVLAFILGGGITNMIWPNMIYVLSFADIPYGSWVKHIWKLVAILIVVSSIAVSVAYLTDYGPF